MHGCTNKGQWEVDVKDEDIYIYIYIYIYLLLLLSIMQRTAMNMIDVAS